MRLLKSFTLPHEHTLMPTPGLNAAKDKHMHGATCIFIDGNHFKLEGVVEEWKERFLRSSRHVYA